MDKMEHPPQDFATSPPPYPYPQPPPQPQPQPPTPPPQQAHTVIVMAAFGTETQPMVCPHCRANISTRVETEANTKTHLFALLLCVLGFWCCAPFPYCTDSCMAKKHYCPSCGSYLGSCEN